MNITVYLGANPGNDPALRQAAGPYQITERSLRCKAPKALIRLEKTVMSSTCSPSFRKPKSASEGESDRLATRFPSSSAVTQGAAKRPSRIFSFRPPCRRKR